MLVDGPGRKPVPPVNLLGTHLDCTGTEVVQHMRPRCLQDADAAGNLFVW